MSDTATFSTLNWKLIYFALGMGCAWLGQRLFHIMKARLQAPASDVAMKRSMAMMRFSDNEQAECKMVLVARTDLGMGKGKIAAQCCHAAVSAFEKASRSQPDYVQQWRRLGQQKVVLKIDSEEALLELHDKAEELGMVARLIHDAGRTQIAAGSTTVLAIGPAPIPLINQMDEIGRVLGDCNVPFKGWKSGAEPIKCDCIVTFSRSIDSLLNGGIHVGSVTEVHGTSGTGKTQLCLQAAISTTLPRCFGCVDGNVVYIDSELTVTRKRWKSIADGAISHLERVASKTKLKVQQDALTTLSSDALLSRIRYSTCRSVERLVIILRGLRQGQMEQWTPVRLLVLDSVGMLFKGLSTSTVADRIAFVQRVHQIGFGCLLGDCIASVY